MGYVLGQGFRVAKLAVSVELGSSPGAEGGSVAEWLACWTREQYRARIRVPVLGKLFTPIVPLFTKQRNW